MFFDTFVIQRFAASNVRHTATKGDGCGVIKWILRMGSNWVRRLRIELSKESDTHDSRAARASSKLF